MDLDFRPIFAGLAGCAVLLSTLGVVWALYGRRRGVLWVAVPVLAWAVFAGIPSVAPPLLGVRGLMTLAGMLCVAGGAALAVVAARARRALGAAEGRPSVDTSAAMVLLRGDTPAQVTLEGRIEGDPPLIAPVSGVPCLCYRVDIHRASAVGQELVGLEDLACDRVVVADGAGRLAVDANGAALRAAGAPVRETVAEGTLEGAAADARLVRAFRQMSHGGVQAGGVYRVVERAVPTGEHVTVVGRLVRRGGEPVLVPLLASPLSLRFGRPQEVTRSYRRLAVTCAVLAAASVLAGFTLLAIPKDAPVDEPAPAQEAP